VGLAWEVGSCCGFDALSSPLPRPITRGVWFSAPPAAAAAFSFFFRSFSSLGSIGLCINLMSSTSISTLSSKASESPNSGALCTKSM